ncbi:sulfurtransferase complex subunit TusD [Spongiibacter sp. KMU-158]|uniref:Sulfurtransferase complex subunit TusD n=1 Tax=Spongiibacter pelagi TaxID=2760804 RepID=A0A927GXQ2_9GAMM|nr:sulfurtransferase complex subunit TusD [Spongiibacter pelagi]MBD2859654.1 sulfurtransferase complex subunit TusD [Spongiibacter pelagi]
MKLQYAILVTSSQAAQTAYDFAQALNEAGHSIYRVFFLGEGVTMGHRENTSALLPQWQAFQQQQSLDLVLCSSSANKFGVRDQREAKRQNLPETLADTFCISGLGQWLDACENADRIIRFDV